MIKISNVQGEEFSRSYQNGAVDEALGSNQTGAVGCGDAREVNFFPHKHDMGLIGLSIVGTDAGHKAGVSHSETVRDIGAAN